MKMEMPQLQKKLEELGNDKELSRTKTEIAALGTEIKKLEDKRDALEEKRRQREAAIVTETHDVERLITAARDEERKKQAANDNRPDSLRRTG